MKNKSTRLSLIAALVCSAALFTFAAERDQRSERTASAPRYSTGEQTERLQNRSQLVPSRNVITSDYIHQRIEWLKVKDPAHYKAHLYIDTMLAEGYEPFVLDAWLDGLYDGVVVVGMPGELVLDYYGDPLFINNVLYDGTPALEWGIPLLPGRIEKVTIADGKVVHVRG